MTVEIYTSHGRRTLHAIPGELLADAASRAGFSLNLLCGGQGACGKCRVSLEEGRYEVAGKDVVVKAGEPVDALACQTHLIATPGRFFVPDTALMDQGAARISDDFHLAPGSFMPSGASRHPAIAVDVGTTTVVAVMLNTGDGSILARASRYNQQIRRADDVASRISYCSDDKRSKEMQQLFIEETFNPLVEELCRAEGVACKDVGHVVLSGNTVMAHLALGLSPEPIGRLPFMPDVRVFDRYQAGDLGMALRADVPVDIVPCVSGYIGGDIVSDLCVVDLERDDGPSLLVDIGTNGEIVFYENGEYAACAAAAGPAFEGAGIACGCRAADGAVEHLRIGDDLDIQLQVIGHAAPKGLCGTAVIDFVAEAYRCELLNMLGRFDIDMLKEHGRYLELENDGNVVHACLLASPEKGGSSTNIFISEYDIEQVLKAKAAVLSGIETLLSEKGRRLEDLNRVVLAGGFARYMNLDNAMAMGLLPRLPPDDYEVVGNASLAGACRLLLQPDLYDEMKAMIDRPDVVELNYVDCFQSNFIEALMLPE